MLSQQDVTDKSAQIISALHTLAEIQRQGRNHPDVNPKIIKALQYLKKFTTDHLKQETDGLLGEIQGYLLNKIGIDPKDINWNVFRLFAIEDDETRWTQWLAGTLRPENGKLLSELTWFALCDALSRVAPAEEEEPWEKDRLINGDAWNGIAKFGLKDNEVHDEFSLSAQSRPDLLIETPKIIILIENKLWSPWSGDEQPRKYRADFHNHVEKKPGKPMISMVLLAADFEILGDIPKDFLKLSYRDLAQSLRRQIGAQLNESWNTEKLINLWPSLLTIVAIEQDLLDLDWPLIKSNIAPSPIRISELTALLKYLRGEREQGN